MKLKHLLATLTIVATLTACGDKDSKGDDAAKKDPSPVDENGEGRELDERGKGDEQEDGGKGDEQEDGGTTYGGPADESYQLSRYTLTSINGTVENAAFLLAFRVNGQPATSVEGYVWNGKPLSFKKHATPFANAQLTSGVVDATSAPKIRQHFDALELSDQDLASEPLKGASYVLITGFSEDLEPQSGSNVLLVHIRVGGEIRDLRYEFKARE